MFSKMKIKRPTTSKKKILTVTVFTIIIVFGAMFILPSPDKYLDYLMRGITHKNAGEYEEAIVDYSYAIALKPDFTYTYILRAYVYQRLDQYDLAIEDYMEYLEHDSSYASAYNEICWSYVKLQRYETALEYCNQSLDIEVTDYTLDSRCWVYTGLERYDEAMADCNKAIGLTPNEPFFYISRGNMYYQQGEYGSARDDYCKALKVAELYPEFVYPYEEDLDTMRLEELGGCS